MVMVLLGGCWHSSRVQLDYLDVRDECRDFSEDNFAPYVQQYHSGAMLGGRDKNAILAKLFADCMYQKGWTVASPGQRTGAPPPQGGGGYAQQPQAAPRGAPESAAAPIRYIESQPPRPPEYAQPVPPSREMTFPANRQPINAPLR